MQTRTYDIGGAMIVVFILVVLSLSGCATNPDTGERELDPQAAATALQFASGELDAYVLSFADEEDVDALLAVSDALLAAGFAIEEGDIDGATAGLAVARAALEVLGDDLDGELLFAIHSSINAAELFL